LALFTSCRLYVTAEILENEVLMLYYYGGYPASTPDNVLWWISYGSSLELLEIKYSVRNVTLAILRKVMSLFQLFNWRISYLYFLWK